MAKSKLSVKDIRAHLFLGIIGNHVDLIYHDDYDNGAGLGAALASVLEEDDKLFGIISAAMLTACETRDNNPNWEKVKIPKKEKDISKKSNIVHKKPTKVAK